MDEEDVPPVVAPLAALPPAVLPADVPPVAEDDGAPEDCALLAPWFIVDEVLVSVDDWFAVTPLDTLWSPLPTLIPGLIFAPALMSVLLMPTLASTPTFGLTSIERPVGALELEVDGAEPPAAAEPLDWVLDAPWFIVDDVFISVELWFAETLLDVDWSPPFTFTPGLTFAPAFTLLPPTPTFAFTPTFGSTVVLDWPNAGPKAPRTAAAVRLTANRLLIMH